MLLYFDSIIHVSLPSMSFASGDHMLHMFGLILHSRCFSSNYLLRADCIG